MERAEGLGIEVEHVVASPVFERSATLTRLLRYLYEFGVRQTGCASQFDIATEGLGKASDFDETTDSSVRVAMSRLRKALAEYYSLHQAHNGLCIYIKSGEYRLRSAKLETSYPDLAKALDEARSSTEVAIPATTNLQLSAPIVAGVLDGLPSRSVRKYPFKIPFYVASLCAAVFALSHFGSDDSLEPEAFASEVAQLDVPSVSLDLSATEEFKADQNAHLALSAFENELKELLHKSLISKLRSGDGADNADYTLLVSLKTTAIGGGQAYVGLKDSDDRILTERNVDLPADADASSVKLRYELIRMLSPDGPLAGDQLRKASGSPSNGFECFLQLENLRTQGGRIERLANSCLTRFENDRYWAPIAIRQAFTGAAIASVNGETLDSSSIHWRRVGEILERAPDDSYANALAAKLLGGQGRCSEARPYVRESLSRGRTFPALVVSVGLDNYTCGTEDGRHSVWDEQFRRIAVAIDDPEPLLEAYMLLAMAVSNQAELMETQKMGGFSGSEKTPLGLLSSDLRKALRGDATAQDLARIRKRLPAYVFSDKSRNLIMQNLAVRKAADDN